MANDTLKAKLKLSVIVARAKDARPHLRQARVYFDWSDARHLNLDEIDGLIEHAHNERRFARRIIRQALAAAPTEAATAALAA